MSQNEVQGESIFPWLVFKLKESLFAVSCESITSITILPDNITNIPHMPDYMRGVLNLRGTIIPLLDMRALFGINTIIDDISINKYIQAHQNWVSELIDCTKTGKPFTLALDPHQCAFGVWYDSYKPSNHLIAHTMKKIDEPHTRLHGIGAEIVKLLEDREIPENRGKIDELLQEVQGSVLPTLTELLKETTSMIAAGIKEMIIVLEYNNTKVGLIADEVQSVDQLVFLSKDSSDIKASYDSKYVKGVGKSTKADDMILLIDEDSIITTFKQSELVLEV